jgi:hypothetical protein
VASLSTSVRHPLGEEIFSEKYFVLMPANQNLLFGHAGGLSEWEFVGGESSGQDDPEIRNFGRFGRKASKAIVKIDCDIGCWVYFLQGLEEGDK